jgi:RimJ/RimL family protein N-acetyltransferase
MAKIRVDPEVIIRVITEDDLVVGYLLSWSTESCRMLGYWIGREFWGRGLASLGLRLFINELPMRPLQAHVASTNLGSQKVLDNNGFSLVSREPINDSIFGPIELLRFVLS